MYLEIPVGLPTLYTWFEICSQEYPTLYFFHTVVSALPPRRIIRVYITL